MKSAAVLHEDQYINFSLLIIHIAVVLKLYIRPIVPQMHANGFKINGCGWRERGWETLTRTGAKPVPTSGSRNRRRVSYVFRSNVFTNEQLKPEPDRTSLVCVSVCACVHTRVRTHTRAYRCEWNVASFATMLCINLYHDRIELILLRAAAETITTEEINFPVWRATMDGRCLINHD